jgi:protein tyrosine phosphatase (PTP) superfamily phosphohydrolase (DUF442 family)
MPPKDRLDGGRVIPVYFSNAGAAPHGLALGDLESLGPVTPLGGISSLLGWVLLALARRVGLPLMPMKRTSTALTALALLTACNGTPPPTLRNFANPMPEMFTSGQPTEAQFSGLRSIGITRVVQLRPANEPGSGWEEEAAAGLGLEFVRLPIAGGKDLTRDNVQRFADEVSRSKGHGTLVCCASSNRVGALFALKAFWIDGQTKEQALELGRSAGMTRLEPEVQRLLDQ